MNTPTPAEPRKRSASLRLSPNAARVLVWWWGNQRAAAAAIGIPQSTLHGCLHPTRRRDRYAADAEYRESHRAHMRERYWSLSGVEYNRLLLRQRHAKALARMAERKQRKDASGPL